MWWWIAGGIVLLLAALGLAFGIASARLRKDMDQERPGAPLE